MRRHLILFAFLLIATAAATAQSVGDSIVVQRLDTVEVRATRASRQVTSTAPLHLISAERMKLTGVSDIADAMHRLPGITLRDYGGAGGLKTVAVRGMGSGHTGVLYDGIPLSDSRSGQIDISRYSLDNVSSLQLTVGDNDDIFIPARAAASAASLAISTTPTLADTLSLTAQMRLGSWDLYNPFLRVGVPLGHDVAIAAAGEFTHAGNDYPFTFFNGEGTRRERRTNSRMNSGHTELNLAARPGGRSLLAVKAYWYDNSRRLPGPIVYYNNVCHERLRESNAFGQASFTTPLGSHWSLRAAAKFDWRRSLYRDTDGKYPGGELRQDYWQREAYTTATLLWLPAQPLTIAYAADYAYGSMNSNLPDNLRPRRNTILQSLTARWRTRRVTAMARLLGSIYLNGASRGHNPARDARRLSPSASVAVQPFEREQLYLRLAYKDIFRVPTFNEAYFDHYGSENLLPETTSQLNLGLTWSPRPSALVAHSQITLDGYLNHVRDMIVGIPYNMFIWRMVNQGKVRVLGLDLTATATFAIASRHSILLSGNYSYQRAQTRTDPTSTEWNKQVAYIPEHSGSASISYTNPWVSLAWHTTAVGERYASNNNLPATRIAGYAESGITLWRAFTLGRNSFELRADILNIFDKQYAVVARYPMPGRSWQLTLRYKL